MSESLIMKKIQTGVIDSRTRCFRNNVGSAWQGSPVKHAGQVGFELLMLKNPRRIKFGLADGSSDLIGFRSITITPDMVGKNIAVFSALEIKSEHGSLTTEQKNFIDMVNSMGGLAGVAHSLDEALWILNRPPGVAG